MPTRKGNPDTPDRVTAIALDGNSLVAAVVSVATDGLPRLHALRHMETEDLVERVDRIAHPIHMNCEQLVFPDQQLLSQALGILLQAPEFRHPLVGVLPPDLVDAWNDQSPQPTAEHPRRVLAGIRAIHDGNPLGYPKLISYDLVKPEEAADHGDGMVRLWTCRFGDVLSIADQLLRHDLPFLGVVTGQRALHEVVGELSPGDAAEPFVLCELGKLRTTYAGTFADGRAFSHTIPVGVARDDNRYFGSFVPTLPVLKELAETSGGLFIPPDYTPTSFLDAYPATPQMEITRFASNVSEYLTRLLRNAARDNGAAQPARVVLTGLATAIPGLRDHLECRSGTELEELTRDAVSEWGADDPALLDRARHHLPAIGGALAFLRMDKSRHGIVTRERRPRHFMLTGNRLPQMEPGVVYVMDWNRRG